MPITSTDLAALSRLLDQVMELEAGGCEAWIAALPDADRHLEPMLREVLAERDRTHTSGFLSAIPLLSPSGGSEEFATMGELVGPYRLIREIGRGGMGTVWLAERADGTLKRHIALKLPRLAWGAGLAKRMARERDIGALLEHPNIGRLYDAGVDDRGRPYLALEYIDGQPLDAWCESQALCVRDRLRLVVQVARAVAYAHGRLVVHRDLKPSNVLVSADGEVHLLDFGIAKLLHEAPTDDSQLTQDLGRVMTPHYASPEQIRGETITVASDVYSLGVLLYELLTRRYPYEPEARSVAAMEALMLQDGPPPASSRAQDKSTERALRGDVDAILAKALKREPQRRYATVDALADDIERYLVGEPVRARPDGRWYRLRKTVVRHRYGVLAGAAVVIALSVGGALALNQLQRATEQTRRARMATDFVAEIFRVSSRPSTSSSVSRATGTALDIGAELIQTRFAGQLDMQAELFGVVGKAYADMGATRLAMNYAHRQFDVLTRLPLDGERSVRALLLLASACANEGQVSEAEAYARQAVSMVRSNGDLQLEASATLADLMLTTGQANEAELIVRMAQKQLEDSGRLPSVGGALMRHVRSILVLRKGQYEESVVLERGAIAEAQAAQGSLSQLAVRLQISAAHQMINRERFDEAASFMNAALANLHASTETDQIKAAVVEARYWTRLFDQRGATYPKALAAIEKSRNSIVSQTAPIPEVVRAELDFDLASLRAAWGEQPDEGRLMRESASTLKASTDNLSRRWQVVAEEASAAIQLTDSAWAESAFRERLAVRQKAGYGNKDWAALDWWFLSLALDMQGRYDEAEKLLDLAPHFSVEAGLPISDVYPRLVTMSRARLRLDRGDAGGAFALLPAIGRDTSENPDSLRHGLIGEILCSSPRPAEGLPILLAFINARAEHVSPNDPDNARTRAVAAECALRLSQRKRAKELATLARAAFAGQPGVHSYYKIPLQNVERSLASRVSER